MKKKIIGLFLITFAVITVSASTLTKRKIELNLWSRATRSLVLIPIDASIEDNSHIIIKFFEHESQPITFQIKDSRGNIIFQDMVIPNEQENYKIDLNGFKQDQYELFYLNERITISGKFYIE